MPVVHIHVHKGYAKEEKKHLMKAICTAITEAFSIADRGLYCCISEYAPEDLLLHTHGDFLHVAVDCFAGRSTEQKQTFYRLAYTQLKEAGFAFSDPTFLLRE